MSQTEMKSAASSPTPSASSPDVNNKAAATKLCHIVKRPDFDGYGFNLHSEKAKPGQFIGKVDANSPAEQAGLKEGDRIMEVNGVAINSESHKQVVQRIKAVAGEVRLLLIDVDGKGDGHLFNGQQQQQQSNGKTEQVLPGASENINSITMVSTIKRPSQESQRSSGTSGPAPNSMDVTDKAINSNDQQAAMILMHNNNNNNNIPPPPSATMASPNKTMMMMSSNTAASNNNNNNTNSTASITSSSSSNGSLTTELATGGGGGASSSGGNSTVKPGSLQLNMTAAEMRAKLMMKKKYDPKNESVDLKKKYEIVQKL